MALSCRSAQPLYLSQRYNSRIVVLTLHTRIKIKGARIEVEVRQLEYVLFIKMQYNMLTIPVNVCIVHHFIKFKLEWWYCL